jgi:hypothetical protein
MNHHCMFLRRRQAAMLRDLVRKIEQLNAVKRERDISIGRLVIACMAPRIYPTSNTCDMSDIAYLQLSKRADPFTGVCVFCNFVRNRIYVSNETQFKFVLMTRDL